jgi:ADP-ribose pyrophosphatase YjhB (NUDIX family)
MANQQSTQWLAWAREIQAMGQTGLTFSQNEYDLQRYQRLLEIAAEIVATYTTATKETALVDFRMQTGYATPKVDVRGAVVRDGDILLVQERSDERWCLPGGWADVGSRPSEMVVREMAEESGFQVIPRQVVGIYDGNRDQTPQEMFHAYKIVFLCEIVGGHARAGDETLAVDFFSFDALPPLSSHRTNKRHLQDIMDVVQNGIELALFD